MINKTHAKYPKARNSPPLEVPRAQNRVEKKNCRVLSCITPKVVNYYTTTTAFSAAYQWPTNPVAYHR